MSGCKCGVTGAVVDLPRPGVTETHIAELNRERPDDTLIGELGRDEDGDPEQVLAIDIACGLAYASLTFPTGSNIAIALAFVFYEP